ncbi:flavin reductase family protein [Roseicyclus sp. F158]|uniref:Flavin reductase family protein n=1 Tax=Tropicimonas omnivorans TaxID=3075590 RepID=A0ABU3DFQ2_9RHOB|nr:flavin reductase family protein [Roseicyclus sp. F158]MDT0682394.1 flavin reductase family protein [Roseicyclus sp. F158]
MFYEPSNGHGLPHNPFSAIVSPRPIGWISTRGTDGHENLAPYSFFNAVAYTPPQVMFSSTSAKPDREGTKDSMANIRDSGVFCVNIVDFALKDAMNASSGPLPKEVDEFDHAGLERAECETIACSRVAAAPASLECRLTEIIRLPGETNLVAFGVVTGIHMRDDCLKDGIFDITSYRALSRCGYQDYAAVDEVFQMTRPG